VRPRPARAALFDLDGTLLDTAPDMAGALATLLRGLGREPLPYDAVRMQVSHGSIAMIRIAFPELEQGSGPFETLRMELLDLYRARIADETRLFEGFDHVLGAMEQAGLPWGIVTNKPGWLTAPLLEQLGLAGRAGAVLSGDTLPERKPHPRPLIVASGQIGVPPGDCLFIGDALRDVQAAVAAGMRPLGVRFGYLDPRDAPETWAVEGWLDRPVELLAWLGLPLPEHA
jgi:N-acetyl-D-muramate 6-phosphate phosphatase